MKIPKLRFKEFSGEWEEKRLGDIADIKGGYAFKSQKFLNNKAKYQVIKMGNIYKNKLLLDRNPSYLKEISLKEKEYLLEKNDIILTLTGTVGKKDFGYSYQIENEKNLLLNQRLAVIKSQKVDCNFLKNVVSHKNFLNIFFEMSLGGTGNQANVSLKDVEEIKINFPNNLEEQEKIGNFLSNVDKKISITEEKLNLFKEYKKGIMQKIFKQEIRFKDKNGQNYPDWEEKRLGDIADIYDGTHQTPTYVEKGIPFYSVENITNSNFFNSKYVSEETYQQNNKKRKLEKNDILMTRIGSIGESKLIDWDIKADFYVSLALIKVNLKHYPSYINQFIKSNFFQKQLAKKTLTVAFPQKINLGDIGDCLIKAPIFEEQQKIANFLSSIDNKIENLSNELENLKEFKKGLLQKMFI